jgi:hypothetical protein
MKQHWPRPDFLVRSSTTPPLAWLWLATAAAVFAVTAHELWTLKGSAATLTQTLVRAENALKQSATATTAATTAATTTNATVNRSGTAINDAARRSQLSIDAPRKAQAVVRQLDHPWAQILSTLEMETPPGLQWLMFDLSADSAELRFEGLAPTGDVALDLVTRLSARKGWTEVVLSRLQAPQPLKPDASGAPAVPALWRFEIKAQVGGKEIQTSTNASTSTSTNASATSVTAQTVASILQGSR